MKNEENKKDDNADNNDNNNDDVKEKDAARSSVSFSSEKEAEEPWPFPLL